MNTRQQRQYVADACQSGRLKQLRKHAGMTQKDVAEECGVSHVSVCKWESGTVPHPKARVRLAQLLKRLEEPVAAAQRTGKWSEATSRLRSFEKEFVRVAGNVDTRYDDAWKAIHDLTDLLYKETLAESKMI